MVYLPADGFIYSISKFLNKEFAKVKPYVDTTMVAIAIVLSFVFLGYLAGVREGTVISAIIIGPIVNFIKGYADPVIDSLIWLPYQSSQSAFCLSDF